MSRNYRWNIRHKREDEKPREKPKVDKGPRQDREKAQGPADKAPAGKAAPDAPQPESPAAGEPAAAEPPAPVEHVEAEHAEPPAVPTLDDIPRQ